MAIAAVRHPSVHCGDSVGGGGDHCIPGTCVHTGMLPVSVYTFPRYSGGSTQLIGEDERLRGVGAVESGLGGPGATQTRGGWGCGGMSGPRGPPEGKTSTGGLLGRGP